MIKRIVRFGGNVGAYLMKNGPVRFTKEVCCRLSDAWYETLLNVDTGGHIQLPDLGIHNEEFIEYAPIGYFAIFRALRRVPVSHEVSSFVDYGSGKGRPVIAAATFPFARVLGVEVSDVLNRVAEENVKRMRFRRAREVAVVAQDAAKFELGDDINVIYMANPFKGATLKAVVDNILRSYERRIRPIYIIYFNKIFFEQLIAQPGYESIQRLYLTSFHPNYSCAIYRVGAAA